MVRAARAVILAVLVATLWVALYDGLEGLAREDWEACLYQSDGSTGGPERLAARPLPEVLTLFGMHMGDTARLIWAEGHGFGAKLFFVAFSWLPAFLLALPIWLARPRGTRIAFALGLAAFAGVLAAMMLPPEAAHHCDRNAVRTAVFLSPIIALCALGLAVILAALAAVVRAHSSPDPTGR
ncbi:MAG: hypothetical protein IE922_05870 [Sphingomonadales bacterium]|nr:hypothetical protein [Sphingomonadales bacterium]